MPLGLLKKGPTAVGKYDLVEHLGSGGMGRVYLGRDRETGAVAVAVKVLRGDVVDNPKANARLVQEFRAAAKLDHPNIVRVLDLTVDGSSAYLVMEFVKGESLGDLILRKGRVPEAAAVRVVAQVAQGLHYAHARRVVHRDVKPDNILIRSDGLAKLADFGLAKDCDDDRDLTRPATGLGTPHFMAPEQYENAKQAGPASDVYALAATLYTALTGTVPFAGATSLIALHKKIKGDVPSPRELVASLSKNVDQAIRQALDPDPARRPSTCLRFMKMLTSGRHWGRTGHQQPSPVERERRTEVRHLCTLPTTCVVDHEFLCNFSSAEDAWPAVIHDVGVNGVGLVLGRRFEPGAAFAFECPGPNDQIRVVVARVVNVRPESLGHWFHGCRFDTPLSPEGLEDFLRASR